MPRELLIVGGAQAGFAIALAWMAVLIKRAIVRAWRRWQVQLEDERCALESSPIYCGRRIE